MHPSLLPRFRGAAPIQGQILADERKTGVTIMLIDEAMDHGSIVAQASIEPEPWPLRYPMLEELLAREGGRLLAETLPHWLTGKFTPEEQDHSRATYTKKVEKSDGFIELDAEGYQNYLKFCAYYPSPGISFSVLRDNVPIRVKITDARYEAGQFVPLTVIPENGKETEYRNFSK